MEKEIKYISRLVDSRLEFLLKTSSSVNIKGPRGCGKTTTALKRAASSALIQDSPTEFQDRSLAKNDPSFFLVGEVPRLIDEWQTIPFIWDSVRLEVDRRSSFGQFILTCSAMPNESDDGRGHSGIGRIVPLVMRTMSLYESGDSNGMVSLKGLFYGDGMGSCNSELSLRDYTYLVCRGGWPSAVSSKDRDVVLQHVRAYYSALIKNDFQVIRKKKRGCEKIQAVLRSYSRSISSEATLKAICTDSKLVENVTIHEDTLKDYLEDLDRLFIRDELPAWVPKLRCKATVITSATRHFTDPSIACAALDLWPDDLRKDLCTMGLFFESLVIHDLRVYAESFRGSVYHYRDSDGLEVDAVIRTDNGKWAAVEVELCDSDAIESSIRDLLRLKDKVDKQYNNEPEFLMVVTATGTAYRRVDDGVYVVPLGCLGP